MIAQHFYMPEELVNECSELAELHKEPLNESRLDTVSEKPKGPNGVRSEFYRRGLAYYAKQVRTLGKLL